MLKIIQCSKGMFDFLIFELILSSWGGSRGWALMESIDPYLESPKQPFPLYSINLGSKFLYDLMLLNMGCPLVPSCQSTLAWEWDWWLITCHEIDSSGNPHLLDYYPPKLLKRMWNVNQDTSADGECVYSVDWLSRYTVCCPP